MVAPLREQVTAQIRAWIVDGHLAPGQRLVERSLCERLGVSRATLRESYRLLEAEGLISMTPNKGPTVTKMTTSEARDVYEFREAIECCAVRLFVERASKEQMAALRKVVEAVRGAYKSDEVSTMLSVKAEFYEVLYAGAGNTLLWEQARSLHHRLAHLRVRSLSQPGRPRDSLREIEAVFKAIRQREAATAEALWREHIRNAAATALAGFDPPTTDLVSLPIAPLVRRGQVRVGAASGT
jgi:DNA-binding GntR family transcriptional regulator